MRSAGLRTALVVALVFLAALAGVLLGSRLTSHGDHHGTEIHALLHKQIALDAAQEAQLDALEARFTVVRARLDAQMRVDNARLADAMEREHGYGPGVAAAVEQSHRTMIALQKATLTHVFAMRALLRPDQAATFDRVVVRALTATP